MFCSVSGPCHFPGRRVLCSGVFAALPRKSRRPCPDFLHGANGQPLKLLRQLYKCTPVKFPSAFALTSPPIPSCKATYHSRVYLLLLWRTVSSSRSPPPPWTNHAAAHPPLRTTRTRTTQAGLCEGCGSYGEANGGRRTQVLATRAIQQRAEHMTTRPLVSPATTHTAFPHPTKTHPRPCLHAYFYSHYDRIYTKRARGLVRRRAAKERRRSYSSFVLHIPSLPAAPLLLAALPASAQRVLSALTTLNSNSTR